MNRSNWTRPHYSLAYIGRTLGGRLAGLLLELHCGHVDVNVYAIEQPGNSADYRVIDLLKIGTENITDANLGLPVWVETEGKQSRTEIRGESSIMEFVSTKVTCRPPH